VVAFQQNLAAATDTHQVMSKILEAGILVAYPHESEQSRDDEQKLGPTSHKRSFLQKHQSPAPTAGAVCTRTGTLAGKGDAFGMSAVMVPKIMMISPVQIQGTIGFK
jgi:hypothetical protein